MIKFPGHKVVIVKCTLLRPRGHCDHPPTCHAPEPLVLPLTALCRALCVRAAGAGAGDGAAAAPALMLDPKASAGRLAVPEEPKVSHGDDNLSLEDFLASASARV